MDGLYCPHCGSPVAEADERCRTCGATLHNAPPAPVDTPLMRGPSAMESGLTTPATPVVSEPTPLPTPAATAAVTQESDQDATAPGAQAKALSSAGAQPAPNAWQPPSPTASASAQGAPQPPQPTGAPLYPQYASPSSQQPASYPYPYAAQQPQQRQSQSQSQQAPNQPQAPQAPQQSGAYQPYQPYQAYLSPSNPYGPYNPYGSYGSYGASPASPYPYGYGAWPAYPYPQYPQAPSPYGNVAAPQAGQAAPLTTPTAATVADGTPGTPGALAAASAPQAGAAARPPAPGYPAYPQGYPGVQAPYSPYGYGAYGGYGSYGGYGAYGSNGMPGYFYYPYPIYMAPRRAPGETYALVVAWITTSLGGLAVAGGLLLSLLLLAALSQTGANDLATLASTVGFALAPLIGGGFALYFGIRGILRRPSPRFSIPNPWIFLALAALVLAAGIVLWNTNATPGSALIALPLVLLSGILPALTIFSFAAWRLRFPSTKRHVWMSLFYGLAGATALALILEGLATIIIALILASLGYSATSALSSATSPNPSDQTAIIVTFIIVSVVAPLVEEGVKPLGAVFIMRRLRTPASAFLLGLAAGIGFDMFETIGYIGMGQADWISVAIERLGAGLLHGVGAGMGALGWYYLINGKGVSMRWWRGFGCLLYAVLQHAIFNGSSVVTSLPGPFGQWTQRAFYIDKLPIEYGSAIFFIYYVIILGVLVYVTGRLARSRQGQAQPPTLATPGSPSSTPLSPPMQPSDGAPRATTSTPIGSSAR